MTTGYFHGLRHELDTTAIRPITTQSDESIFLVGTSSDAEDQAFPINQTVLLYSAYDTDLIAALGTDGDLPKWVNGIQTQVNARIFIHRVAEGASPEETISNIIGGIDPDTGKRVGLQAAFDVKQTFGLDPSIFIAPSFSQNLAVATEMAAIAKKLAGVFILDGPNAEVQDAVTYRNNFDERHGLLIDPHVRVWNSNGDAEVVEPSSARVAGVVAATPWWESASSRTISGITGLARDIDYRGGDGTSRAELLNQNHITTIVRHPKGGFKLFGGRSLSADPKFAFFKRSRVINVFNRTILDQMQWAVDRNMTRRYYETVADSVNKWLRREMAAEHIAGGKCWVNPRLNTPEAMEAGDAFFDYDFVDYGEAEKITFTAHINNGYLADIVPTL